MVFVLKEKDLRKIEIPRKVVFIYDCNLLA